MSNRISRVLLGTLGGTVLALASGASAQGGPPPGAAQTNGIRSQDVAAANRQADADYNTLAGRGVEVTSDKSRANSKQKVPLAQPAAAADLMVGASVRDVSGAPVATIERLEADGAVVRSEDRLAKLPLHAFGKDAAGLMLGITAAEFRAAIADTSIAAVEQEPQIVAATAADIMLGAGIRDSEDVLIGTVDSLSEDGVIVVTDGKKVKLPVNSFGKDEQGLVIGITASEFKAIIGRSASTGG
jgi:hypothetical protein